MLGKTAWPTYQLANLILVLIIIPGLWIVKADQKDLIFLEYVKLLILLVILICQSETFFKELALSCFFFMLKHTDVEKRFERFYGI